MKEKDYNKWLDAKSEVEHFDGLDENIKETIYSVEQNFVDGEEVYLEEIHLEKKEIIFAWIGYEKALEILQEEYGYDEIEAEEEVGLDHEMLTDALEEYSQGTDWCFNAWVSFIPEK